MAKQQAGTEVASTTPNKTTVAAVVLLHRDSNRMYIDMIQGFAFLGTTQHINANCEET